jgi:hypothetical protein
MRMYAFVYTSTHICVYITHTITMNIHIYIIHHTHKHRDACILDKVDSIHRKS